jgi:hypothetical protein
MFRIGLIVILAGLAIAIGATLPFLFLSALPNQDMEVPRLWMWSGWTVGTTVEAVGLLIAAVGLALRRPRPKPF